MKIYRGDQYALPFIVEAGGTIVTPSMVSDMKIKVGDYVGSYQQGTFLWDEAQQFWYIPLTEALTRSFRSGPKRVTIGIKVRNEIFYCDEQTVTIADNQIEGMWEDV